MECKHTLFTYALNSERIGMGLPEAHSNGLDTAYEVYQRILTVQFEEV